MHPGARDAEIPRHVGRVVVAHRHERIHRGQMRPDQRLGARSIRLEQTLDEDVLSLQGAVDRASQRLFQRTRDRDQHRVGDVQHVGTRLVRQPVHELVEFLALVAVRPLEHRHRQRPESGRAGLDAVAGDRAEQPGRLPEPVEQPGGLSKERQGLLEVDADPAEEHPPLTDVLLVGAGRGVERQQGHVVPSPAQRRRERVVAQATAAVHATRAGRHVGDFHESLTLKCKR